MRGDIVHTHTRTDNTELTVKERRILKEAEQIKAPRFGIRKSTTHQRLEFQHDTQQIMMQAISRAMKGLAGEWEDKIFKGLTPMQRWALLTQWLKYVLPAKVQLSGEVGIKKIEISYEEPQFEKIENPPQQDMIENFNEEKV